MNYMVWSQILYELALAVSGEQDLDKLLKKSLPVFMMKLDCTFATVLQEKKKS